MRFWQREDNIRAGWTEKFGENSGKTVGKPEPWKPEPYVKLVKHLIDVRGQCSI